MKNNKQLNYYLYAAGAALSLLAAFFVMRLDVYFIDTPILHNGYSGDGLLTGVMVKNLMEHPWYYVTERLGAPFGLDLRAFPMNEFLHLLILKFITFFSADWTNCVNIYFILLFPLTTLSAIWVARQWGIGALSSIFIGLLYAFLPSRFFRGEAHLFLAAYYTVPLAVHLVLLALKDKLRERIFLTISLCVLVAFSGIYYAWFTCFFLCFCAVLVFLEKNTKAAKSALLTTLVITVLMIAGLAPSIFYNGAPKIAHNESCATELYGLKLAQLILPASYHRIDKIRERKTSYNSNYPLVNENDNASLGLVFSLGFIFLIASVFWKKLHFENSEGLDLYRLSSLNLAAVLIATVGGFSSLVGLFFSQIRAYNRISVFIAFFCALAIGKLLDLLFERCQSSFSKKAFYLALPCLGVVALLDMTPAFSAQSRELLSQAVKADHAYFQELERRLPASSAVLQLPYFPFPESPPVGRISDYDLAKAFLHTETTRWSYGAMKTSANAALLEKLSMQSAKDILGSALPMGYQGILFDEWGPAEVAAKRQEIARLVGDDAFVSKDGRYAFVSFTSLSPAKRESFSHNSLPLISYQRGFSVEERSGADTWRWCDNTGEMIVSVIAIKKANEEALCQINAQVVANPGTLSISSPALEKPLLIVIPASGVAPLSLKFKASQTGILFSFQYNGPRINAPKDPRSMYFQLRNLQIDSQ